MGGRVEGQGHLSVEKVVILEYLLFILKVLVLEQGVFVVSINDRLNICGKWRPFGEFIER